MKLITSLILVISAFNLTACVTAQNQRYDSPIPVIVDLINPPSQPTP